MKNLANNSIDRRDFFRGSAAACMAGFIPGLSDLQLLRFDATTKKRLVIMFSPNGMVREGFWPATEGPDFEMTPVLQPLESLREQTLVVHGICNKIRGDGDNHMRGMSCLLTANELFPGNIQGGSDTPAGWAKGISIDQELKGFLQSIPETRTRFGTLEFGIRVPEDANPWTRMVYAGPNQPLAPISDPYRMFSKMYDETEQRDNLLGVLDLVKQDLARVREQIDERDRQLIESHSQYIQQMKNDLTDSDRGNFVVDPVKLPANVANENDNMPELSKMQIDLLVNGFANDLNRIATLQYTKSVGDARMNWLDVNEGHHALSHNPDDDKPTQDKLTRINVWYCQQLAYLAKKLQDTKEPGSNQSLLDNTLILWTNELGHGNSHSLNNLPMVMLGGGFGFKMGRFVKVNRVSTDRLWLAIAHAMGHPIESFGKPGLSKGGALAL
jgi:hypothetical protein